MIEIYKFKDIDLSGATIVEGFPTVGLVSIISANFLIEAFNLDQICAIDSPDFPPVSMVYASRPKFPARIYAAEEHKIAVFLTEFTPTAELARPIADKILIWAIEQGCSRIITPEGLPSPNCGKEGEKDCGVYGVGSSDHARKDLKKSGIEQLQTGIITGVSAVLLNEGRRKDFDVISLLAEVHPDMPDARAAAKIIESINKLVKKIEIDAEPLYEEAERIEKYIRGLREQIKPVEPSPSTHMYG
ncbi:MAG: PAC2 family protein [Halobacteriota archaeon]|nr:PAC2 family protein [Halobacteriota archaeon]